MSVESADANLDGIFNEVGGFGLFQAITFALICIPTIISSGTYVNYMIAANTLDHRCKVPECDVGENNRDIQYDQPWLQSAIPFTNGKIDKCFRYAPKNSTLSNDCSAERFDNSTKIECTEFIYATDEKNVQTEFNIHCSDSYKLALVGTVSNVGRFIFLPFTGLLSDKFGRLKVIINGMILCSIFGIMKSFSTSYMMYIVLEFLESSAGTCTFAGSYVLAIELVSSRYRVVCSTLVSLSHPVGGIVFAIIAMHIHDFRWMFRISYFPGLLLFVHFWLVPESIRWLLVSGRIDEAIKILKRIARVNRKELSNESIEMVRQQYAAELCAKSDVPPGDKRSEDDRNFSIVQLFCTIFKSKTLSPRLLVCCYQWVACCFGYYGISLSATQIPGENRYVSFMTVVAVEIPAVLITIPLLNRMKRRVLLFSGLFISGVAIIATAFIPEKHSTILLLAMMLGKASMTCSFSFLYIFTAEQWPTNLRTTIMNFCSMIGRIGSMVSPLVVIVGAQYGSLPAFLFASSTFLAAICVFFNPETYSKKLPDTIDDTKNL